MHDVLLIAATKSAQQRACPAVARMSVYNDHAQTRLFIHIYTLRLEITTIKVAQEDARSGKVRYFAGKDGIQTRSNEFQESSLMGFSGLEEYMD